MSADTVIPNATSNDSASNAIPAATCDAAINCESVSGSIVHKSNDDSEYPLHDEQSNKISVEAKELPATYSDITPGTEAVKKIIKPEQSSAPDGGWGWVIVACVFFVTAIVGGSYTAFSLLYMEFVEAFEIKKSVAGWIGSIYMATGNFLGIFYSYAVQCCGSRIVCITGALVTCIGMVISSFSTSFIQLYFFYGLLSGAGVGMMVLSSLVLVQQYFSSRRAMAAGIAVSGYSIGSLVAGPFISWLISIYTWRPTLWLIGGIFLQVVIIASLYRPVVPSQKRSTETELQSFKTVSSLNGSLHQTSSNGKYCSESDKVNADIETVGVDATVHDNGSKNCCSCSCQFFEQFRQFIARSLDFSLMRRIPFTLYVISVFCVHIGMSTFLQHMPSRAAHFGIEKYQIALLPTITGVSLGVSRIVFGFVANAPRFVDRMLQYSVTAALSGVVQTTISVATSFEIMAVYCVVVGVINGGFLSILTTLLVDLNGVENVARSVSIWSLFVGAGMLLSVPFAGFLFDMTRDYNLPFIATGLVQLLGGLIGLVVFFTTRCCRRKA